MDGPIRSKLSKGPASTGQWRHLFGLVGDSVPTLPEISFRAAEMIRAKPSLLQDHIRLVLEKAEQLAPWWDFYDQVVGRPFPAYTTSYPTRHPDFSNLLVLWGVEDASEAANIAEAVGFKITVDSSVGPLEKVPNRWDSTAYVTWTQDECQRKALGNKTINESLYSRSGIRHTDVMETLLLLAQHYFETGRLWNSVDRIVCHAFRNIHRSSYSFYDKVPTIQLRTADFGHPEIYISTIGINESNESLKAICLW